MATDTLTLRIEERGGVLTAKKVEDVGDEVEKAGKKSRKSSKDLNIFSRTIQFMGVRAVIATVAIVALSVASLALAPQIAAVTAAMFSLGAIVAPIALLAAGAMMIFKDTVEQAGSSASELRDMFAQLQHAFRVMVAPAAALVFQALTKSMEILIPVLESLRPAMTEFGRAVGGALVVAAQGLADAGPQFSTFLQSLGPVLMTVAQAVGPLTSAFLALAQLGLPMLQALLSLLVKFLLWFSNAIPTVMEFTGVGQAVGGVLRDLGTIFASVYDNMQPFLAIAVQILGLAWVAFAGAIHWIAQNMDVLGPIIAAVAEALIIAGVAWGIYAAAMAVANAVMAINPFIALAIAIVAVTLYLIHLYNTSESFRQKVNEVWTAVKNLASGLKDGIGAAIDWLVPKIMWLIDKLEWIFNHSPQGLIAKGLGQGVKGAAHLLGLANGTPSVTSGGAFVVGEQGPEVVHLPAGSAVTPNGGGDVTVHATLVMPDGTVLARQTLKAARKAQSVR